jgi:DNA-binding IclR family transcriptional regulator
VIARAAEAMRVLAEAKGMSLSDVASAVGLARSTTHRIIASLEKEGLVVSNGPGGYRLGPSITLLAEACKVAAIHDLHPYMRRLSQEIHETVDLSILTGNSMSFVDQVIAPNRLRAVSAIGVSFPLYCTANGKAVLAAMPPDAVRVLLPKRLERFTAHTCTSRSKLEKELDMVRRTGIAMDREAHTVGICAVGACVSLGTGDFLAISIPLPAGRFYGRERKLAAILRKHCAQIVSDFSLSGDFPGRPGKSITRAGKSVDTGSRRKSARH